MQATQHNQSLQEILITAQLGTRRAKAPNSLAARRAFRVLANTLPLGTAPVLQALAHVGIELCRAGSAGISIVEHSGEAPCVFRWCALAGELAPLAGELTPRNWSPCGVCLDERRAVLFSHPARYFTYFNNVQVPIVEGLFIPILVGGVGVGTIWVASHEERCRFDGEDARVMTSLAGFAAAALAAERKLPFVVPQARGNAGSEDLLPEYLHSIATGDHCALDALIECTRPMVFALILRIIGLRADAEEVTSDIYSYVWRSPSEYDPTRGAVMAWLLALARSRAFDRLRTVMRATRRESLLFGGVVSASDPERDAIASQSQAHLSVAVDALPPAQRDAIRMAYFEGLTSAEIAQRIDEPHGTVKTRLRLALIRLRRLLAATER